MRRVGAQICLIVLLFFTSCSPLLALQAPELGRKEAIAFGSGEPGGLYHVLGAALEKASAGDARPIANVSTRGAWDNLARIADGELDIGLTQLDTAVLFDRRYPDKPFNVLRVVFFDWLHILVRSPLSLQNVDQFRDLRIWMDDSGSGTEQTARRFLDLAGVSQTHYERIVTPKLIDLSRLFDEGQLDIALFVGAIGSPAITGMLGEGTCSLFGIDTATARHFLFDLKNPQGSPLIFLGSIPSGAYPNQYGEVQALMVPVVLATRPGLPEVQVQVVSRHVDEWLSTVGAQLPVGRLQTVDLETTGLPLHSSAGLYRPRRNLWEMLNTVLVVLSFSAVIWLAYTRWRQVVFLFRAHLVLSTILGSIMVIVLCAMGAYISERQISGHFQSVFESLWSITLFLLSGLEDRGPVTLGGRIFATIALLMGPVIAALVTGFFASTLIVRAMEKRMSRNLEGHYLILNWGEKAKEIIRQLHAPFLPKSVIAILTDDASVNFKGIRSDLHLLGDRSISEDVLFSAGDPTDEASLLNVNVQDARCIIILAANGDDGSADERTIRSIVLIKKIAKEYGRHLHVVAEFVRIENVRVASELAVDFPGTLEAVALGEILTLLLASSAINEGLIDVYRDLLSASADSNEVYAVPVPSSAAGMAFNAYAAKVISDKKGDPVIPIGLRRRDGGRSKIALNPLPQRPDGGANPFYTLLDGDELLVVAFNPPLANEMPGS